MNRNPDDISLVMGEMKELLEVTLFTAAYAAVVSEEVALRGMDPNQEKPQIVETRRSYRKAAHERLALFKKLLGVKNA
jgi:hypothetical protein